MSIFGPCRLLAHVDFWQRTMRFIVLDQAGKWGQREAMENRASRLMANYQSQITVRAEPVEARARTLVHA